ncbi:MAG: LysR family transcriptional regulator [Gammaproteobacteria bacterium]|nr:LysR family transcriptional regulator [Gammaproteobacteria bacterium]
MNDWDDLRYFLAIARSGNVTGAAMRLGVNHSTVSRRITAMEKRHGVRLFERMANGYEMTESASAILEAAEAIEAKNLEVERTLFGQDKRLSGSLKVTMPHDLANFCIIPRIKDFYYQYPDIALQMLVSPGLKDLAAREADIAIRLTPNPPDYLIGQKLADMRHGIYQSIHYQPNQDNSERVILWNQETSPPIWVTENYPNAKIALRVDDLASMYAAIKAGLGIARIPCYLPDTLKDSDIKRREAALKPSPWGVWLLSHVDLKATARVDVCKQFLKETLLQQQGIIEGECSNYL